MECHFSQARRSLDGFLCEGTLQDVMTMSEQKLLPATKRAVARTEPRTIVAIVRTFGTSARIRASQSDTQVGLKYFDNCLSVIM